MFKMGRKVLGQVWNMFDKSSTSTRNSRDGLVLGKIEETDHLGVALHKEATYGHRRALRKVLNTAPHFRDKKALLTAKNIKLDLRGKKFSKYTSDQWHYKTLLDNDKAICVDYPNDLGQTPLFCACARDNESTAVLLLQWRANPNEKSLDGMTPCHATAYIGNVYLLGKLIEAGGDLRLHDNNQNSLRDWALKNPDLRKRSKMVYFIDQTQMRAIACNEQAICPGAVMAPSPRPHMQTSVMGIMKRKTGSDFSFESLRRVQSTGFGKVYLGNNYNGGIISAVPLISEAALQATGEKKCDTGSHSCIERKLRHPNILLLMGICQSTNLDRFMLIVEYVQNLTLHHFLHQTASPLSFHDQLSIMQQICAAMDFIHSQHLIHCGLSSMAVYLVSSQVVKVGNFEFMVESIRTDLGKPSPVSLVSHGELLYNWMSPELLQGLAPHYSSDVYSFCCIVWELYTREIPWKNLRPENIRKKVVEDQRRININIPKIPENIKRIIGYGLELEEKRRLNTFSFIIDGLKCDQVPIFQRTSTPHYLRNKSDNFPLSLSDSSTSSTSSLKNKANTWDQDRLDFSRLNERNEDGCTSDSLSVSGEEIDDGSFTLPHNYVSSHSEAPILMPHNNVLTSVSANSDICKKLQENRKCVSDSDLKQHQMSKFLHTNPVKPASHLHGFNPGSQPLPGSDPYQFQLIQSNSEASAVTQHRNYASQSTCGTSYDKPKSAKRVKKMADLYQAHLSQQKLRQAILKGSMAPDGHCQDLESSSESRRSSDSQTGDEKYHIDEEAKHLSTEKSMVDVDMSSASAVEANKYSHLKSSTPQESVGPDRKTNQQLALENRDSDCHKELPCRLEEDEIDGYSHTHHVLLQEVKAVQQKLMSRSVGAVSKLPSGIDHQSPHTETCCPPAKLNSHLSKLTDSSSSQNETLVLPSTSKLQPGESLHRKVRIQSVCQTSDGDGDGKENNCVCDISSHTDTCDNTDHQTWAQILDLSSEMDELQPILKAQESRLSFEEKYSLLRGVDIMKKRSGGIIHRAGQLDSNKHLYKTSDTTRAQEAGNSLKENKQRTVNPASAEDADMSFHLEASVTREDNMASGVCNHDDSASCTQKISIGSERIDHWIASTLAKIKEKVKLRSCILDEETESADTLCSLTDIFTASTLEEDGDKKESSCHFHPAVSKVDDEFKVDKGCNFEFREFYIDDDFDSTQYYQQDKPCFQAAVPHCMTSAKHSADDTSLSTVAEGSVKQKAEFFSRMMTNVNPSEFPRIPKKLPEPSEKNIPCANLSVDNIKTEKKNAVSSREIRDSHTLESEVARPCVLKWRNGVSKVISTSWSDVHGRIQTRLATTTGSDVHGQIQTRLAKTTGSDVHGQIQTRLATTTSGSDVYDQIQTRLATTTSGSDIHGQIQTRLATTTSGSDVHGQIQTRLATTTSGSDVHGQIQTRLATSRSVPECGDFPSKQLIQVNERNKASLNKEDSLHCFSKHAIINKALEEQTIIRKRDFKDVANQETVPKFSTPLDRVEKACQVFSMEQLCDRGNKVSDACCITQACQTSFTGLYHNHDMPKSSTSLDQVDKACQVISIEQLCDRGNKVSDACCITQACQTSFTGMYPKYGATAESDSDSDLWVKSRLITIQEKIHRRRARLAYSVSSDESSGDERFSPSQQPSTDSRCIVSHERTSVESDIFTGCRDKENIHFVNSKTHKDHSQNGLAVKRTGVAEQKISELQHFTTNRDSHNERQRKESLRLSESCFEKKKLKSKRHDLSPKLVNSTASQQCDDLISTNCGENKVEVNASKRPCTEMPILQVSAVSNIPKSHKKKSSSKSSEKGCVDCVDNSRVNIDYKGSANLCEVSAQECEPLKETRNSTSSHGCETSVDDSVSKKSHQSILRRPRNLSTNVADLSVTGTNSLIPPPVPLSRSKFSLGLDSKVSDRVISFQDISDSEPEIPDSEKELMPLKPSRLSSERSLQRKESLDSSKSDEFVKTWLEREDFAERFSLGSSRQIVPQSITSKVMEMQSMSSKEASVSRKISAPALSSQSGNALLKLNSASLTSKQSAANIHETGSRKQSASKDAKECMNLNLMDCTFIMPDSAEEEQDVELTSNSNQVGLLRSQSKSNHGSQKSSVTRDHDKNTLPGNINNDRCVTLDLSSFSNEYITECSSFKGLEKASPLGVHRFYIPRERCHNGCTAKLNISLDASDPAVHRITSTTTDPVSGLTETLLDHTICTHKLRSTIKLE